MNEKQFLKDISDLIDKCQEQQKTIVELRGQIQSMEDDEANRKWYKEQVGIMSDCVTVSAKTKANELDRYAIPAMQGLCASECEWVTTTELVIEAYDIAEAMITERNKRTQ